jgi:hypothetical protein
MCGHEEENERSLLVALKGSNSLSAAGLIYSVPRSSLGGGEGRNSVDAEDYNAFLSLSLSLSISLTLSLSISLSLSLSLFLALSLFLSFPDGNLTE